MGLGGLEAFEHQVDHGDMHPCLAALGALLVVFVQPSAPAQPSQSALDYPPSGQDLKVVVVWFALDNGQHPTSGNPGPRYQSAGVTSPPEADPDNPQLREEAQSAYGGTTPTWLHPDPECWRREPPPPAVRLRRIYYDVPLASGYPFASVVPSGPPFSVVFTDWLSMMAALGVASRPAFSRTRDRRAFSTRSQVPSSRQLRKYHHTVPQGGRSWGIPPQADQAIPPLSTYPPQADQAIPPLSTYPPQADR